MVVNTYEGLHTPSGKIEVLLETDRYTDDSKIFTRLAIWNKTTIINVERG